MKLKLRTKLLLITAALVLLPLSILSIFVQNMTTRSIKETFRNNQIATIKKAGAATNNMLNEIDRTSLLVITNYQMRTFLTQPPDIESRWNAYSLLGYLKNSSETISTLHLLGNGDGRTLTLGNDSSTLTKEDLATALAYNGRPFWKAQWDTQHNAGIYICRLIRNVSNPTEHLGFLKVYLRMDTLFRELYNENDPSTNYYILDETGDIIYATDPSSAYVLPSATTLSQSNNACLIDEAQSCGITPYKLSGGNLILVGVSSLAPIRQQVYANRLLYFGISFISFVFCLLLSYFLSTHTLAPLTELITHMRLLEQEDFSTRIRLRGDDEISKLAKQFNSMAAKIQSLIEEVYLVSLRRKEAELRALQTQIKPHFLYNTLDLAYWTAQTEKAPMTAEMVNSLSQFFRFGLISNSNPTTLENEIEHLRFYITLQRQHNPNFDYNQQVDEALLSCRVVKLVLQPLVENAFIHGIAGKADGQINLEVLREGDMLVYNISDNGEGINIPDVEQLMFDQVDGTRGVGLRNINDRIQLAFGEEYGIKLYNRKAGGTHIKVTQPIVTQESKHDKINDY